MKAHAEKGGLLIQPWGKLISRYFLENGTNQYTVAAFLLGFWCWFANNFIGLRSIFKGSASTIFFQSAMNARRRGGEIPNSSVLTETMKSPTNSSYGCQSMDRSRHTVASYLGVERTQREIKNKLFEHLGYIDVHLNEIQLVKSENEHKKPIIVDFLILQFAKPRMLELRHKLFDKDWDVAIFEELEMDTDSLYLAVFQRDLYDCIRPTMKQGWNSLRSADCTDDFSAILQQMLFFALAARSIRKTINENLFHWRKNSAAQKKFVCLA